MLENIKISSLLITVLFIKPIGLELKKNWQIADPYYPLIPITHLFPMIFRGGYIFYISSRTESDE